MIALVAALVLSVLVNAVLIAALVRYVRRLFEFDELFTLLVDDIDTNIKYFGKLLATPVFTNSPEIIEANNNMGIIAKRLNEFVLRMEEASNRFIRKRQQRNDKPPVVVP